MVSQAKNHFRFCMTIYGRLRGVLFLVVDLQNHQPKGAHLCAIETDVQIARAGWPQALSKSTRDVSEASSRRLLSDVRRRPRKRPAYGLRTDKLGDSSRPYSAIIPPCSLRDSGRKHGDL